MNQPKLMSARGRATAALQIAQLQQNRVQDDSDDKQKKQPKNKGASAALKTATGRF